MYGEYNSKKEDNASWEEQRLPAEMENPVEKTEVEEFPTVAENNPTVKGKKRRKIKRRRLSGGAFLTTIAAIAVFALAIVIPPRSVEVEFVSVLAKKTEIYYTVNVEESQRDLMLVVTNGVKRFEAPLQVGENIGTISGLVPDMGYTVSVVGNFGFGEKKVISTNVRTTNLDSIWRGVTHECTCNVDGQFHFLMDFIDENGWFTDFTATVTDADGNVATCSFNDNLHSLQSIDVVNTLIGNEAHFYLTCNYVEPGREEMLVLVDEDIKI